MNEALMSVIVATHDRPRYLRDLLDSLYRLTYPRFEVVAVDAASDALTENTRVVTAAGVLRKESILSGFYTHNGLGIQRFAVRLGMSHPAPSCTRLMI